MEALRASADASFRSQRFTDSPSTYELTVLTGPEQPYRLSVNVATLTEVENIAQDVVPFLMAKIVLDRSLYQQTFHAKADDCSRLFDILNIDQALLGLVATDMTGFHCLRYDAKSTSYYQQCFAYKLVWSYDPDKSITRAISFVFDTNDSQNGFAQFVATMEKNLANVAHPLFLPLSAGIESTVYIGLLLREQYKNCLSTELATGAHLWKHNADGTQGVLELSEMSKKMSGLVTQAEMALRRVGQLKLALTAFQKLRIDASMADKSQSDVDMSVSAALTLITSRLSVMEIDFNYVRARASNQLTTMITRDDALANISLAKAAWRDSTSMKVVAIMTMVFLPGTFFAALFSVPSLDWTAEEVIQDKFWMYWAFTLPSTVLVFVLWALLTQKNKLARLRDLVKRRVDAGGGGIERVGKDSWEAPSSGMTSGISADLAATPLVYVRQRGQEVAVVSEV